MTAPIADVPERRGDGTFLIAPFDGYSDHQLLEHFCTRRGVTYFPILDEDETQAAKIDAVLDNRFEFNGECHQLASPLAWLDNPSIDVEWHILLHKFYYAAGLGQRFSQTGDVRYLNKWAELIDSWIAVTPPGFIASDVTGRRVQNWIYAHYYFIRPGKPPCLAPGFYRRFLASLSAQVEYLCANLAPARNHRTLELYAIFLTAVVFPEMRGASAWLKFSLVELARNVETDLLPDGVQVELSTDYHHIVLRNFLCVRRLAEFNGIDVPEAMDRALVRALEFSMHAHRPDGIVPSFSDGDARDFRTVLQWGHELYGRNDFAYAASLGLSGTPPVRRCASFAESGYHTQRSGWGEHEPFQDERYLMLDCGPLGAGNHGHFDLLSFEAYGYGVPLVVDPGRYTYSEAGEINWRACFRGTEAHNTVLVDGRNQTRYTPGKRKLKISGQAPRHTLRACVNGDAFDLLHGLAESHEYPVVHERLVAFVDRTYWIISDLLWSESEHSYDQLFQLSHLAQGGAHLRQADGTCLIEAPHMVLAQSMFDHPEVSLVDGFVSQRYGEKHPAPKVRTSQRGKRAVFHSVLYPYGCEAPAITVRQLQVASDRGEVAGDQAQAVAITIGRCGQLVTDYWFFNAAESPLERRHFGNVCFDGRYLFLREADGKAPTELYRSPGTLCKSGMPSTSALGGPAR